MLKIFTLLANYFTYNIFQLEKGSRFANSFHFFIEDTTKIFVLTALIIFVMGFFKRSFSEKKVQNYLDGKPKWFSYLLAVILGWITPFCSCSSIPLFIGFLEAGVHLGVTMTFLAVSPMPIEAIAILGTRIGFKFSMLYMLVCGFAGVVFGIIVDKMGWKIFVKRFKKEDKKQKCCCAGGCPIESKRITFNNRINDATNDVKEILSDIWLWIFAGILVGSFLHGYVPQEFFVKYATTNKFLSIPFAVILGIPLYSNATGIIPIMESLFLKGVPLGTVLTFMMSITALSLPQMIILTRVLKKEMIIRFIGFLTISFMIIGWIFNYI